MSNQYAMSMMRAISEPFRIGERVSYREERLWGEKGTIISGDGYVVRVKWDHIDGSTVERSDNLRRWDHELPVR